MGDQREKDPEGKLPSARTRKAMRFTRVKTDVLYGVIRTTNATKCTYATKKGKSAGGGRGLTTQRFFPWETHLKRIDRLRKKTLRTQDKPNDSEEKIEGWGVGQAFDRC